MRGVAAWSAVAPALLLAAPCWAGSVTIVNGGTETIRAIQIAAGGGGENRLRSTLPPGATARITYSTGCQAVVRLSYESGRVEEFAGVDPCTDPRVVAGSGSAAAPGPVAGPAVGGPAVKAGPAVTKAAVSALPTKAPPPVVPPWTGRSITKKFGGME